MLIPSDDFFHPIVDKVKESTSYSKAKGKKGREDEDEEESV